jgi:hypothetical protein
VELHSKQQAVEVVEKWLQEEEIDATSIHDKNTDYNLK